MGLIHDALSGRGGGITKTKDITENGTYKAVKDDCDGYSEVYVDVKPKICDDTTITENGIYFVPEGFDGFGDITVDVQSVGLDDIVKLPTYASHKVGTFEYLVKIGKAVGKTKRIIFSGSDGTLYEFGDYEHVYVVICENNEPILAYDHCEILRKDEYYDRGNVWYTKTYTYEYAQDTFSRYNWTVKLKQTETTKYPDTSEPVTYISSFTVEAVTDPFQNNVLLFTGLNDQSLTNFAQRLNAALNSLS